MTFQARRLVNTQMVPLTHTGNSYYVLIMFDDSTLGL